MQLDELPWLSDWAFSLPLIVICTVIHVIGLALIKEWVVKLSEHAATERGYLARFGAAIALVALLVTLLHTAEALIWAGAYLLVEGRREAGDVAFVPQTRQALRENLAWARDRLT